jgi:transcriptional regulator with XRE-family HTH domain
MQLTVEAWKATMATGMSETFGKYLRAQRNKADVSLRKAADKIGVSHVFLGEVERGERAPLRREHWAKVVAAVPGVTIEDLERHCAVSRPVQLSIDDAPPEYQDLTLALARRIQKRDLSSTQLQDLLGILKGSAEDDDE